MRREDGMDYLTHNEIETEALGETLARRDRKSVV